MFFLCKINILFGKTLYFFLNYAYNQCVGKEWFDDKNKFLQQITELTLKGKLELNIKTNKKFRQEDSIIKYEEKSYKLIGLQFYNENIERKEGKMEREIEKYFLNND